MSISLWLVASAWAEDDPKYEPPQPVIASVWRRETLDRVPWTRSIAKVVATTPGVVPTSDGLSVRGAHRSETQWLIDGIDVTDPVTGGFGPRRFGPTPLAVHPPPGL